MVLLLATVAVILPGCMSPPVPPGAVPALTDAGETATLVLQPPQKISQLAYREDAAFDASLNRSMRAGTPEISVVFVPPVFERSGLALSDRAAEASRLHRWLAQVEMRGGRVAVCFDPPLEERRGIALVVWLIVGALINRVHDEALYRPAGAYDARLLVDRDTDLVKRAVFVRRGDPDALACDGASPVS